MALSFEFCEPRAIAAGVSLVTFLINSGPKLAIAVIKVTAILLTPKRLIKPFPFPGLHHES